MARDRRSHVVAAHQVVTRFGCPRQYPAGARRRRSQPDDLRCGQFTIRPERSHQWLSLIDDFTQATRHAAGNIFCEWSRNVDDPHQFIVVEGFESKEADEAHLNSDYFRAAMAWIPDLIVKAPEIVKAEVPQDGWHEITELSPR